jgi:protein phosphatase
MGFAEVNPAHSNLALEAWGGTDVGMKRRLNEDVYVVDRELGLYLVADGMGGHAAGEVASRMAADEVVSILEQNRLAEDETWPEHWDAHRSAKANLLVDAILAGHDKVTRAVRMNRDLRGMGTTMVVALRPGARERLIIGHVGDSRAYRWRDRQLELLTQDHSWVHEQVSAGLLSEDAARAHPLKNVVTQALGGSVEPRVDVLETEIRLGDVYVLCSDGLNSMLTDEEIAAQLSGAESLQNVGDQLIVSANARGGNDNITVVIVKVVQAT